MFARIVLKTAVLLLVIAAGHLSAQERAGQKTGRIEGNVLALPDGDHLPKIPVHSVELFLSGAGRPFSTTEVDSDGHFAFEDVPAYSASSLVKLQPVFRVGAAERGVTCPSALLVPAHLRPDETLKVTLLGRGRPIVGKIDLPPGVQSDRIRVWLRLLAPPFRELRDREGHIVQSPVYQVYSVLTANALESPLDAEGQFRIEGVREGNYRIGVTIADQSGESLVFKGTKEKGYPSVEHGKLTIPFMDGGESDKPHDLGSLKFDLQSKHQ
jgi:hypothetical protein